MERTFAYDELASDRDSNRQTSTLRRPAGRRRDSSIVGIFNDALRHKDGALTVAYHVEMPSTMFADDSVVDAQYDDLARMLAFDKPAGTLMQFRYATIPDPGFSIINVITSRPEHGTHTLASLLQASNLEFLESSARSVPYRRSILTLWVRVPPKRRANSTMSAMANFSNALKEDLKSNGFAKLVQRLP